MVFFTTFAQRQKIQKRPGAHGFKKYVCGHLLYQVYRMFGSDCFHSHTCNTPLRLTTRILYVRIIVNNHTLRIPTRHRFFHSLTFLTDLMKTSFSIPIPYSAGRYMFHPRMPGSGMEVIGSKVSKQTIRFR